jgi:hypothetical protein
VKETAGRSITIMSSMKETPRRRTMITSFMKEIARRRITITSSMKEIPRRRIITYVVYSIKEISTNQLGNGGGVTPPAPTPFYSRILDKYLKTTATVFPPPRIFASWY